MGGSLWNMDDLISDGNSGAELGLLILSMCNKRSSALFPPWTASIVNAMIAGQLDESFLPRHRRANHKANQAK